MMNTVDQERVSGCLLARSNARGELVVLDVLGPHTGFNSATQAELDTYRYAEGAFFGNLFLATPAAYSCTTAPVYGDQCALRACRRSATGACDCGVVSLVQGFGDRYGTHTACVYWGGYSYGGAGCSLVPLPGTNGSYYGSCTGGNNLRYAYPMTTRMVPLPAGRTCAEHAQCASYLCDRGVCR